MQTHNHHPFNKQPRRANLPTVTLFLMIGTLFLWLTIRPLPALAAGPLCYVNAAAVGGNTGADWANAFTSLQSALADGGCTEIWVAQGLYKPSTTGDRTHTFRINRNLTLYGGFPASGSPTLDDRDPTLYPTVLSGDLAGDDPTDANGVVLDWTNIAGSDNSYHVLTMASPGAAVLDGLVVTGGYASSTSSPNGSGSGLYDSASGSYTLRNMVFQGNRSYSGGGASFFYNNSGTVTMQDTRFIGNSGLQGGAMSLINTTLNLTRVLFQENDAVVTGGTAARIGGAIMGGGGSTPDDPTHPLTLTDVQFISNTAAGSNSAIYFQYGTAVLTNVLFQGNNDLGSWPNAFGSDYSALTLTNVVLAGNRGNGLRAQICHSTLTNVTASGNSNYGISLGSGSLDVRNSIIYGNTSGGFSLSAVTTTISYSLVQGGCPGGATCTNVLSANPLFVTPITAPAPTITGDLRLQSSSPAIDAGGAADCPTTDQRDLARDDLGCDIGAYELRYADSDTVIRPVTTAVTTFGPTLAGIRNDGGADDPGVVSVTKSFTWATKPDNTVDAYWHITPGSGANYNLTLQLCYLPAELNGLSEGDLRFWRYSSGSWAQVGPATLTWTTINGNRCAAVSGVTGFSDWTLGGADEPTAVTLATFSAAGQVGWVGLLVGVLGAATAVLFRRRPRKANLKELTA